jgi:glucosamine--fructose-6-phosphate aminotransferase (isomerizing)
MILNISNNIQCINACEFDLDEFNDAFLEKTLFIFISQSGETYDLIKILNNINNLGYLSVGVVNKTGSYISQHTSCGVYVNSGNEVAVAATKSFVNQVIVLLLIGLYISQNKNTNQLFRARIINSIKQFCFEKININEIEKQLTSIVDEIYKSNNMFILGSSFCEAIAGEGSLKIKELTYIHSEAYSMGELKHGPLSLICDNIPVIFFYLKDNKHNDRIISSLSETKLRGSYNILITDYVELGENFDTKNIDKIITVENRGILTPLMGLIPLQLLAYYTSIKKGINPDKPRNLAKTVTVE